MELLTKKEDGATVWTATDGRSVLGYVVVDSTIRGRSCGGLRMLPDVDEPELRYLARSMTLKYGFLALPQGGAKAGIRGDPDAPLDQRRKLLVEFARVIAPLLRSKTFLPCADMGTKGADIRYMLGSVGLPVPRRHLPGDASGYYTALSVLAGAGQAARHLRFDLAGCTAAIEGFGSVGRPLANLLAGQGVKVVAISTSSGAIYDPKGLGVDRLERLAEEAGSAVVELYWRAERIDRAALLELDVDLLCPCARHHSIHEGNAARIAARAICPGANNPLTEPAEVALTQRGVLCLPDFVTNCGGVLGGTMEFAAIAPRSIAAFIERHLAAAIGAILDQADRDRVPPRAVAEAMAMRRFDRVKHRAEHSLSSRLFGAAVGLYRCGLLPSRLVGALAPYYFRRLPAFSGEGSHPYGWGP